MIRRIVLFAVLVQGILPAAYSQKNSCDQHLVKHQQWKESEKQEWHLRVKSTTGRGELLYFGAQHDDEPAHPQFQEIGKQWANFKPTVAFYEGPDRGVGADDVETITKFGESGYVRYLASKAGVRTRGLEPDFADTYKYLASSFPQNQVDIYMITKEAMRLRTRKGYSEQQLTSELEKMFPILQKMLAGKSTLTITSVEQLDRDFKKYWGDKLEWWQAPQEWFDPNKRSSETGGIFTNEINTLSSDYRDVHMYRILAEEVNKGERVFAVVGRNHVPLQAPALKCAIK